MAGTDRDGLIDARRQLAADLRRSMAPGEERAEARKAGMKRAARDVAVQGVGTVLGGGVLAGLAQLGGLLPTDRFSVIAAVIATVGLAGAVLSFILGLTKAPISRSDVETIEKIQAIDNALQLLDDLGGRAQGDE